MIVMIIIIMIMIITHIGLQESVKMEFNFGLNKPFLFDTYSFEYEQITRLFDGANWGYYVAITKEEETSGILYRHPKWLDAYTNMNKKNINNTNSYKSDDHDDDQLLENNNNNSNYNTNNTNNNNSINHNTLTHNDNTEYSLFLDTDLRTSILLDMNRY